MGSVPITSWQLDGETMATVTDFIFLSSKISAYADGSHEIKKKKQHKKSKKLAPWKRSYDNQERILKNRGITLLTKCV